MERIIKYMKQSGLFDELVYQVKGGITKEDLTDIMEIVMDIDENLEDAFFTDAHEITINLLWNELQYAVDRLPKEEPKDDKLLDLLKELVNILENN